MKEFITIKENVQTEIVDRKSKFIANLFYIENSQEAENIIKNTKKKYFDARHNCIAYRTIEKGQLIEKSSDDGEPSGTAGAPMLYILQKNGLVNVLIIVTRYFGGILLGTGGLVRAYSNSLLQAIEKSSKVEKCFGQELEVELEYSEFENFKYYCKNNSINLIHTRYTENIVCIIELEEQIKQKLMRDFERKNINLNDIKELSKKYITKSI
ncbi:MAG: YigZ family protein [Clostridia bacterium]|nr:YigZ family protein [Clostridia bacterium]